MRVAFYARVSTNNQARNQNIQQQITQLKKYAKSKGWQIDKKNIFCDDGFSGASLDRPALDDVMNLVTSFRVDVVLITEPDRLAREYIHQYFLIEQFENCGCRVEFVLRPMGKDPYDRLLLQIRGAFAEFERKKIAERMRRGRLMKLQAGCLLPWTKAPFGYALDTERPRDPEKLRVEPTQAEIVRMIFDWYLAEDGTLHRLKSKLDAAQVATPSGKKLWGISTLRSILKNPAYTGRAYGNKYKKVELKRRASALKPIRNNAYAQRPEEEWICVPIPAIIPQKTFDLVQEKMSKAKKNSKRNNKKHEYLLRAMVSCGLCRRSAQGRASSDGRYHYYACTGRYGPLSRVQEEKCKAPYIHGPELDELVWEDLCKLLQEPKMIEKALERAKKGAWLPQELQIRQQQLEKALKQVQSQSNRLLDAYLAEVLELEEYKRRKEALEAQKTSLELESQHVENVISDRIETEKLAKSIKKFCTKVRKNLDIMDFEQRRYLTELLIDRVVVTGETAEIRYVFPTEHNGPHYPFCRLISNHQHLSSTPSDSPSLDLPPGTR